MKNHFYFPFFLTDDVRSLLFLHSSPHTSSSLSPLRSLLLLCSSKSATLLINFELPHSLLTHESSLTFSSSPSNFNHPFSSLSPISLSLSLIVTSSLLPFLLQEDTCTKAFFLLLPPLIGAFSFRKINQIDEARTDHHSELGYSLNEKKEEKEMNGNECTLAGISYHISGLSCEITALLRESKAIALTLTSSLKLLQEVFLFPSTPNNLSKQSSHLHLSLVSFFTGGSSSCLINLIDLLKGESAN